MTENTHTFGQRHAPTEIRLNRKAHTLDIDFDNNTSFAIPIELLRVESPSAEVQGHAPSQKQLVSGKRDVEIEAITPVGNYAIAITFNDGHDSGYFTWNLLYRYGENQDAMMTHYLNELRAANLSRDSV